MPQISLGVVANTWHTDIPVMLDRLVHTARTHGVTLRPEPALKPIWPSNEPCHLLTDADSLDGLLTLGGDGTLLRGAGLLGPKGPPILGVNLGRVGFLTTASVHGFDAAIEAFVTGNYEVDERSTLVAEMTPRNDREPRTALNDVVVHHAGVARVVQVRVWVDEQEVGQYSADGIIVASPTGSTAYSMSAGGPIVTPDVDVMIVTAISPHTLAVRPLVVAGHSTIRIEPLLRRPSEVQVAYDGEEGAVLTPGDSIVVRRGERTIRLVRLGQEGFFSRVRQKLHWGDLSDREEAVSMGSDT